MARTLHTDLYDEPAYRAGEAARMLALPAATVKAWCFGHDYLQSDGTPKRFKAVVTPADAKDRLLSFNNLCELHMLAAIRRHYRVSMPSVRTSLSYVRKVLQTPRPLLAGEFLTNGVHLFIGRAGAVLNTSREGQAALSPDFQRELQRVERDKHGSPIRLFPATRALAAALDSPRSVVVDPKLGFGRPVLARAGVTTEVIQDRFLAGDSPREMAQDYAVDESDIWEALRFEQRLAA
ncbi:MAG: DUF433 domain-containing protein [Burkholderiales bacterium]|nr:DUF433 domain-containing protein [Burkholderiales bacterium]